MHSITISNQKIIWSWHATESYTIMREFRFVRNRNLCIDLVYTFDNLYLNDVDRLYGHNKIKINPKLLCRVKMLNRFYIFLFLIFISNFKSLY